MRPSLVPPCRLHASFLALATFFPILSPPSGAAASAAGSAGRADSAAIAAPPGSAGPEGRVPLAFVRVPWGNHLLVVDPSDGTTVTRIYTGSAPAGIRALPDGRRIWSFQPAAGTSTLLDAATGRIDVFAPGDAVFSPDGRRYYAVEEEAISEVDAVGWSLLFRSDVTLPRARKIALTPDGSRLLILSLDREGPGADSLLVWDTAGRRIAARLAAGAVPSDLAIDPGGRFAIVAGRSSGALTVIDLGPRDGTPRGTVLSVPCPFPVRAVLVRPDAKQVIAIADSDTGAVLAFRATLPRGEDGAPGLRFERAAAPGGRIEGGAFTPGGTHLYLLEGRNGRALVLDPATLATLREIPGAGGEEIAWAEVPRSAAGRLRSEGAALRATARGVLRSIFLRQRGYRDLVLTEEVSEYGPDGASLGSYTAVRRVLAGGLVREDSDRGSTVWRWGRLVRTTREDPIHSGDWLGDFVYLWRTAPIDEMVPALAGDPGGEADPGDGPATEAGGGEPRAGVAIDILHRDEGGGRPFHAVGVARGDTLSTHVVVDESTGFPLRIVLRRPFDRTVHVTRFDEYRVIDGHWIPARVSDSIDGRLVRRRTLRSAEYDTGLTDATLLAP